MVAELTLLGFEIVGLDVDQWGYTLVVDCNDSFYCSQFYPYAPVSIDLWLKTVKQFDHYGR